MFLPGAVNASEGPTCPPALHHLATIDTGRSWAFATAFYKDALVVTVTDDPWQGDDGVVLVDVSDPASPTVCGTQEIPGFAYPLTAEGDLVSVSCYRQGKVALYSLRDKTPPVMNCPDDLTVEQQTADGTVVEFECAATDDQGPDPEVVCDPPSGSVFPLGDTNVTCTARDDSGNQSQCTFTITVEDTTPPEFARVAVNEIPAHDSESFFDRLGGGSLGGEYLRVWDVAGIWKNADAFMKFDLSAIPDEAQVRSVRLLSYFHDREGNERITVTESSNDTWQSGDPGFPGFDDRLTAPRDTWTGIADGDPVIWDLALGDWIARDLADGIATLVLTHWDGPDGDWVEWYRHTSLQYPPVLQLEYVVPGMARPDDITAEQATADGTAVEFACTASDICDADVDVVCDPPSGTVFPLGTTTVHCTAIDDSGNFAQSFFDVTVEDTTAPQLTVPADVTVEQATADGTVVPLEASATDICDVDVEITSNEPAIYPLGETVVTFTATDDSGNTATGTTTVTVVDTTPPDLESVSADPSVLWPPNHKMVELGVFAALADVCDAEPAYAIISVTSNEPVNGKGDGNTDPDWEITGDHTVKLRAERSGRGDGRIYTITVLAVDDSGNTSTAEVTVTVPHDQRSKGKAGKGGGGKGKSEGKGKRKGKK
jgi:hypothetical protein